MYSHIYFIDWIPPWLIIHNMSIIYYIVDSFILYSKKVKYKINYGNYKNDICFLSLDYSDVFDKTILDYIYHILKFMNFSDETIQIIINSYRYIGNQLMILRSIVS